MRGILWLLLASTCAFPAEPLTQSLRESYQTMRLYLIASAEMMQESDYGFKLTPVSRTFADWLKHTAEMNYAACGKLRGVPSPEPSALTAATAKDGIIHELKASFAFCDPVFRGMTDKDVLLEKRTTERSFYPVAEMIGLTNSLHEHYGNLIGYMRSKGVTPPSTLRTQRVMK